MTSTRKTSCPLAHGVPIFPVSTGPWLEGTGARRFSLQLQIHTYIHTYIHVCVRVHAQWGILYNSKRNSKILLAPVFHFSNREDDQRQELEALRVRLAAAEGREAELRRLRGEGVQQKDEGLRLKGSGRLRHYHEEMECCCV